MSRSGLSDDGAMIRAADDECGSLASIVALESHSVPPRRAKDERESGFGKGSKEHTAGFGVLHERSLVKSVVRALVPSMTFAYLNSASTSDPQRLRHFRQPADQTRV